MREDKDGTLILSPDDCRVMVERLEIFGAVLDELALPDDALITQELLAAIGREVIRRHTARKSGD
jgi:hypothetical protein